MTSQEEAIKRILKRERLARKQAEEVIEKKSLELFTLNEELKKTNHELEKQILKRTVELREKNYDLKQSEAKINLAIQSAELGIWEWDFETEELYFSEQIASSGGYTKEEFSSKFDSFYELIHPKDREGFRQNMITHLKGKTEQFNKELQL